MQYNKAGGMQQPQKSVTKSVTSRIWTIYPSSMEWRLKFKADDTGVYGDEGYPSLGTDNFHSTEHTLCVMATETATERMGRLGEVFDANSGRLKSGGELLSSTG